MEKLDVHKVWHCFTQMEEYIKNKPLIIKKSEGHYLYDQQDQKIFDGVSSLLNASFGHNNKAIVEAIVDQYSILDNNSLFLSSNSNSIQLAKKLCELTDEHFKHVFFTNSGSEAFETAMKIAMKYIHRKKGIEHCKTVALENCYHGSTLYATLLSGNEYDNRGIYLDIGSEYIPVFDQDEVEQTYIEIEVDKRIAMLENKLIENENIGIVITEIVQLSNGATVIPALFFQKLRMLCEKYELLWIADEIATGFGRVGSVFAYQQLGVKPDMMLLGKAISGGHSPLGAVCVTDKIYNAFLGKVSEENELTNGFTTSGNPVACRAALAAIQYMEDNHLVENANAMGHILKRELMSTLSTYDFIDNIQGKGLLLSINFKGNVVVPMMKDWGIAHLVSKRLLSYGLLLYPDGNSSLIVAPPLSINEEDITFIVQALDKTLALFQGVATYEAV